MSKIARSYLKIELDLHVNIIMINFNSGNAISAKTANNGNFLRSVGHNSVENRT